MPELTTTGYNGNVDVTDWEINKTITITMLENFQGKPINNIHPSEDGSAGGHLTAITMPSIMVGYEDSGMHQFEINNFANIDINYTAATPTSSFSNQIVITIKIDQALGNVLSYLKDHISSEQLKVWIVGIDRIKSGNVTYNLANTIEIDFSSGTSNNCSELVVGTSGYVGPPDAYFDTDMSQFSFSRTYTECLLKIGKSSGATENGNAVMGSCNRWTNDIRLVPVIAMTNSTLGLHSYWRICVADPTGEAGISSSNTNKYHNILTSYTYYEHNIDASYISSNVMSNNGCGWQPRGGKTIGAQRASVCALHYEYKDGDNTHTIIKDSSSGLWVDSVSSKSYKPNYIIVNTSIVVACGAVGIYTRDVGGDTFTQMVGSADSITQHMIQARSGGGWEIVEVDDTSVVLLYTESDGTVATEPARHGWRGEASGTSMGTVVCSSMLPFNITEV